MLAATSDNLPIGRMVAGFHTQRHRWMSLLKMLQQCGLFGPGPDDQNFGAGGDGLRHFN